MIGWVLSHSRFFHQLPNASSFLQRGWRLLAEITSSRLCGGSRLAAERKQACEWAEVRILPTCSCYLFLEREMHMLATSNSSNIIFSFVVYWYEQDANIHFHNVSSYAQKNKQGSRAFNFDIRFLFLHLWLVAFKRRQRRHHVWAHYLFSLFCRLAPRE